MGDTLKFFAALLVVSLATGCDRPAHAPTSAPAAKASQDCRPETLKTDGRIDGEPTVVTVYTYDYKRCMSALKGPFWGGTDLPPERAIGQLSVARKGVSRDLPLSAFADLSNPAGVSVLADGKTIEIHGKGESRYVARIEIVGGKIARRMVTHPGFEHDVFEKTEYKDSVE